MVWGRVSLQVRALAVLVYKVGIGSGSSDGSGSAFVERAMSAIASLAKKLPSAREGGAPRSSPADQFRRMGICACITTCTQFPPIGDSVGAFLNTSSSAACLDCLMALLSPSVSDLSDVFASRAAGNICAGSDAASNLRFLVMETLFGSNVLSSATVVQGPKVDNFSCVCRWISSNVRHDELAKTLKRGHSPCAVLVDPMAAVNAMQHNLISESDSESLLKDILEDPRKCEDIFHKVGATSLIRAGVDSVTKRPGSKIPLVLPLRLEALACTVSWEQFDLSNSPAESNPIRFQFILQLLYAMLFKEQVNESPFSIDPRALPLGPSLLFCELQSKIPMLRGGEVGAIFLELKRVMLKYCPDMMPLNKISPGIHSDFLDVDCGLSSDEFIYQVTPMMVAAAIKVCVQDGRDDDGLRAERLFLKSRADFPAEGLYTIACSALLSSRNSPSHVHSYTALCHDPLLLLRCNVSVWHCRGIRRIVLLILRRLLDANEVITRETALSESVAAEMLAARDVLVARCLIVADSGGYTFESSATLGIANSTHCPMTVSLIRSLVARKCGLVTVLIKQGLPDKAVDWLTEYVPESLGDSSILAACLSERNTLTAAERLTAADAALRIAIAHGSSGCRPQDASAAQNLAFSALSVLVSSFFLVLGPVGVPVNVVCQEDGHDVTQTCRRAMFRMLSAILRIGCKKVGLKNEARLALGKLAGLCKSESAMSGVVGVVAMRRKALLKEIWDAVVRAVNSLGGGVQV